MDFILYPTFNIIEGKGLIPQINLPDNFRERVKKFYVQGRKEDIEAYTKDLEKIIKSTKFEVDMGLLWHEQDGLTNISVGVHGGLDLNYDNPRKPHFQEHNLGWTNGFLAAAIATKYVSELLKS